MSNGADLREDPVLDKEACIQHTLKSIILAATHTGQFKGHVLQVKFVQLHFSKAW